MNTKMETNHALCGLISGLLLLAAGTSTVHAGLIYSDSFTRSGNLNGSAPDVTNAPGQTWITDAGVTTDGSQAFNPSTTTGGYLPFTIAANNIYTLQADLRSNADPAGSWIAIGFSPTALPGGFGPNFDATGGPWGLIGDPIGDQRSQNFAGPGTANFLVQTTLSGTGFHNMKIVLDTTAPEWTTTAYVDSVQVGSTFTYETNPVGLSYVGFNSANNGVFGGHVDNFSFSDATPVPEPGTALFGIACVGIAAFRRRRSSAV